jgi:ABC-type glycerol-3-phosphate transport system substrate-binding protein
VVAVASFAALSVSARSATFDVSVVGPWKGADAQSFQAVLDGFTKANPGVSVTYAPAPGDVASTLQAGSTSTPDVAVLSLPGDLKAMQTMATAGTLESLDFALPALHAHYAYSWQALGSVNGTLVGLPFRATNNSAVWYDQRSFRKAGITPPRSWAELRRAFTALSAHGIAPVAIGGGPVALPDLFENLYLMLDGGQRYDQLAAGKIPWSGTTVKDALQAMTRFTQVAAGGTRSLDTDYKAAVQKVFGSPTRAAMVPGGSAALPVLYSAKAVRPLSQFGAFAFPRINADTPRVIGDADVVVVTKANDATKALINYLASPQAATIWAKRGGFFLSPNRGVSVSSYAAPAIRSLATNLAAANVFRLPLSETLPAASAQTFERMLVQYARAPGTVGPMLAQLSAASAQAG